MNYSRIITQQNLYLNYDTKVEENQEMTFNHELFLLCTIQQIIKIILTLSLFTALILDY
jgi:hypothetical protein